MQLPSTSSTTLRYSLLLLLLLSQMIQVVHNIFRNTEFPALIAFGDSIIDPGNNNNLPTPIKANFPPYGKDFLGGKATGRFSNGKIPTDLLANEFGIKEFLPAYLDPNLKPADLLTGVSFASGASGYDPLSSELMGAQDLVHQLSLFKEYTEKLKKIAGEERAEIIIKDALYIVVTGNNDITNTYFGTPFRKIKYNVPAYTDFMIQKASIFIEDLYNTGARNIGVFNIPPLGCLPSQRTLGGGLLRHCAKSRNEAATLFNSKLSSLLDILSNKYQNAKIIYIDAYNPVIDIIANHTEFGFQVVDKGCCGTGKIEAAILCNSLTSATCPHVSDYLFWDGFHPTQKGYEALLNSAIEQLRKI